MEIAINQVYKSFLLNGEKIPVLDNISLTVPHGQCTAPVSYTHLDVYKRQVNY